MTSLRSRLARLTEPPAALVLLAAVALVARLPRLGESLWFDEIYYSTHHRFGTWPQLLRDFAVGVAAPLYGILLHAWVAAFGERELVVRLPSMLFGIGSILLAWEFVRRRAGEGAALLAGLVLALTPAHVVYSQEATAYTMTTFLVLAAALTADRIVAQPFSAARCALFAAALAAAVFTHYFAAVLLLPFAISGFSAPPRARRCLVGTTLAIGLAVVAALAVKAHFGRISTGQGFLRPFTPFEAWMLLFHWFPHGNSLWTVNPYLATPAFVAGHPLLLVMQLAACALLLRGLVAGGGRPRSARLADTAMLATLPAALLVLTLAGYRQLYIERYVLVALPFFVAPLAAGVWEIRALRVRGAVAGILVLFTAAAWLSWWAKAEVWTVYKPNPDFRAAARYLVSDPPVAARSTAFVAAPRDGLHFYVRKLGGESSVVVKRLWKLDPDRVVERRLAVVHLVADRTWTNDFDRVLAQFEADPRLRRAALRTFPGVEVHTFILAEPESNASAGAEKKRPPAGPR